MGYRTVALVLLSLCVSCAGTVDKRVDPDDPDLVGGTSLQSQDIRAMVDNMARDMVASGVLTQAKPGQRISFFITEMKNLSSDPIDKGIVLDSLQVDLYQALGRQVAILDRTDVGLESVQKERAAKREEAVSANPDMAGSVMGADYTLTGTIRDRTQTGGGLKSAYYLVTFRLTDLETSEMAWQGKYETKFVSEKSVISR